MSILVIGGDKINPIKEMLLDMGAESILHWTARNQRKGRKKGTPIPPRINIIVMIVNFLNHNAMRHYRAEAKSKGIPVVYAARNIECIKSEFVKAVNTMDIDSEICKKCSEYSKCYQKEDI
jgi:hypothetical protein